MKCNFIRCKWVICIVFICFSVGCLSNVSAQTSQNYSIGWEAWEPYQYMDENGRLTGLDIELVRAIMNLSNNAVSFKEMPWKRHLKELELGQIDLAAGASKTPEREKYAYFSKPYRTESAGFYILKSESEKWKFKKLEDIIGSSFQLCVTRGYYYGEQYEELRKDKKFLSRLGEVTNESQCYQMVKRGYIDGFIADPFSATAGLRKEGMLDDVEMLFTTYSDNIYIMFSKASTSRKFVEIFNENLEKLKRSGEYYAILKRYIKLKEEEPIEGIAQKSHEPEPAAASKPEPTTTLSQSQAEDLKNMDVMRAYRTISLKRYIKEGRDGENVIKLKILLKKLNYYDGSMDEIFTPDLTQSVRAFQLKYNLSPDGIVGPLTYGALGEALQNII